MADLSAFYQTYSNAGAGIAASYLPANNYKFGINQADVGRELIVKVYDSNSALTDATLGQVVAYLTTTHGTNGSGDDAFTVAAVGTADGSAFVSGTTDTVFLRVQGTGAFTAATADMGISGIAVSVEAIFTPAK
jgi:hypothetical protein